MDSDPLSQVPIAYRHDCPQERQRQIRRLSTARKSLISIGRELPVCTGFPTGTAPPVLSARALSTGELARLVPVGNTNRY